MEKFVEICSVISILLKFRSTFPELKGFGRSESIYYVLYVWFRFNWVTESNFIKVSCCRLIVWEIRVHYPFQRSHLKCRTSPQFSSFCYVQTPGFIYFEAKKELGGTMEGRNWFRSCDYRSEAGTTNRMYLIMIDIPNVDQCRYATLLSDLRLCIRRFSFRSKNLILLIRDWTWSLSKYSELEGWRNK